jgi:hypothetical protein
MLVKLGTSQTLTHIHFCDWSIYFGVQYPLWPSAGCPSGRGFEYPSHYDHLTSTTGGCMQRPSSHRKNTMNTILSLTSWSFKRGCIVPQLGKRTEALAMAMGQSTQFCLAEGHGTCMEGVRLTSPLDGSKSVGDIVSLTMIQVISKAVYTWNLWGHWIPSNSNFFSPPPFVLVHLFVATWWWQASEPDIPLLKQWEGHINEISIQSGHLVTGIFNWAQALVNLMVAPNLLHPNSLDPCPL